MSLIKSPQVTAAKQAANQTNARKSSGPATPPGKTRARLSHLKHGIYSDASPQVLEALGEDASQLDAFEAALVARFEPDGAFEEALVRKIARNFWRVDRCRRVQENTMIAEIERLEAERAEKSDEHGPKMDMVIQALNELLEMTRRGDFSDRGRAWTAFHRAYTGMRSFNMPEIAALLSELWPGLRLSPPPQPAKYAGPPPMLPPDHPAAVARLLEVLEEEIESMRLYDQDHRQRHIEISPAKRASMMGPVQPYAAALIRQEESLARQVERDVRLLYFLKAHDEVRRRAHGGDGPQAGADGAGADAAPFAGSAASPQAGADAASFAGSAALAAPPSPEGAKYHSPGREPWGSDAPPSSPLPLDGIGGETPPLQFAQIGGETPPLQDVGAPLAAPRPEPRRISPTGCNNPCEKANLQIDPTMLMKTKDQILYPTMFMKTQPLNDSCPIFMKGEDLSGEEEPEFRLMARASWRFPALSAGRTEAVRCHIR